MLVWSFDARIRSITENKRQGTIDQVRNSWVKGKGRMSDETVVICAAYLYLWSWTDETFKSILESLTSDSGEEVVEDEEDAQDSGESDQEEVESPENVEGSENGSEEEESGEEEEEEEEESED